MKGGDEHLTDRFKKLNSVHETRAKTNSLLVSTSTKIASFDSNLVRLWNHNSSAGLREAINLKKAKNWAKCRTKS